jgi:transcriptional regulator with XRE-family HTH domain
MSRGDRLREIRVKLGFNQSQASDLSGVLQKEISLLENDKRENIPIEYINWLGNLSVNMNWVYFERGPIFLNSNYMNLSFTEHPMAAEERAEYAKLMDLSRQMNVIQAEIEKMKNNL